MFWLTGASEELTPKTLKVYADALGNSGAWLGADEATWEEVGTAKVARLPFKLGKDQPVNGQLLAWAHVPSGRIFMLGITPPWNSKGVSSVSQEAVAALLTEAAPLVDCASAGAVDRGLAMLDPAPKGYGVDTSSPPTLRYNRPGHALVLWRVSPGGGDSSVSCTAPADSLFKSWAEALTLSFTGEAVAAADNLSGKGDGPRCDVSRPVSGFTEAESGDVARYLMFDCPSGDGAIAALEFVNEGIVGAKRADVLAAVCGSELPPEPEPEEATPAQEKKQWVPGG